MNEQNLARGFLKGCWIFTFREALVHSFNWTMIIGKSSGSSKICRNGSFVSFRRKQLLSDASFKIVDCFNVTVFFVFSYGQITKNQKILLWLRKQKGNAIIRRFVMLMVL